MPDLRKLARDKPCMICQTGYEDPTTVLCHMNLPGNFGMGHKSDDRLGTFLCHEHHTWADTDGRNDYKVKFAAYQRQVIWNFENGIWKD